MPKLDAWKKGDKPLYISYEIREKMKKWYSWKSEYNSDKFDVIIIGSGMSGLTCGAILSRYGKRVLVLEKHFKAGGWTHTLSVKIMNGMLVFIILDST